MMGGAEDVDQSIADPSMTYDIGAELNAVAFHILFARCGNYTIALDAARLETLTA